MPMRLFVPILGLILTLVVAPRAAAQPDVKPESKPAEAKAESKPESKPETKPADAPEATDGKLAEQPGSALTIQIAAIAGSVQFRLAEDQPWQPAKVGADLQLGAEVRTGLRSLCRFTIDGNHTITLDRLGTVKVLDAIKRDGKVKTDVGMKYGRTQYQVEAGAVEHDSKVHAPSGTLAVRGSSVIVEDTPAYGAVAIVQHSERSVYQPRIAGTQPGSAMAMRIMAVELTAGRVEQPIGETGLPAGPAEVALRDTINDIGTRLARANELEQDLVALYPVYNGANTSGGGGIPPLHKQITDGALEPVPDGSTFTPGGLTISIFGPGNIFLTVNEPGTAPIISTIPGVPSGSVAALRPGGPAPAFASRSASTNEVVYGNGIPLGTFHYAVRLQTGTAATFNVVIHRVIPNGPIINIADFSAGIDSEEVTVFQGSFNINPPPPPGP